MPKIRRRWLYLGSTAAALLALFPLSWFALTYQPKSYRKMKEAELPPEQRQREAKRFVSHSLQLRNDIHNEPTWEAVFSDEEVNAWLAEELMASFADQIPAEIHEPRVAFEEGRAVIAFELDRGPIRSVISVVCRAHVPEDNVLALTIDKIQAGIVPLPADEWMDRIADNARRHGLDFDWQRDGKSPVAMFRYTTDPARTDVVLERVDVSSGRLRMSGRSNRTRDRVATPGLPSRRLLQSTFPRASRQPGEPPSKLLQIRNSPRI